MQTSAKDRLNHVFQAYKIAIENEAWLQFVSSVQPYLDKHNIRLFAVWGDFWLEQDDCSYHLTENEEKRHMVDLFTDREGLEVMRVLLTPVPGIPGHFLGHFMPRYTPIPESERGN